MEKTRDIVGNKDAKKELRIKMQKSEKRKEGRLKREGRWNEREN